MKSVYNQELDTSDSKIKDEIFEFADANAQIATTIEGTNDVLQPTELVKEETDQESDGDARFDTSADTNDASDNEPLLNLVQTTIEIVTAADPKTDEPSISKPTENTAIADPKSSKRSPVSSYECYLCSGIFKRATNVRRHMISYHGVGDIKDLNNRYQCKLCDKTFAFHSAMYRHKKRIHLGIKVQDKKYKTPCNICGKVFASVGNQKRHYESVHLGERPFVCTICQKRFSCGQEMRVHQLTHSDVRDYKCDQCPKAFKTPLMLTKHQNVHLPEDQRKRYISKEKVQAYNSRVKICEICGKSLKCAAYYGHIRTHDLVKAFECALCSKRFATKMALKCHGNTHSGERPYKCDLCEKTYRQSAHLYEHRKVHTGARPYKCQFCDKTFAAAGNYNQHRRVHMGVKAYKCVMCSHSYATLKSLKRHLKHTHPAPELKEETVKENYDNPNCI